MAAVVEAGSLSSLTTVAFNPPQYPKNPTHLERQPLVLYIARVPGSRDVFLTTMKPRQKVVTAEDIHSSLYYLHLNGPEDEHLANMDPNGLEALEQLARPASPPRIRRKPLAPESPFPPYGVTTFDTMGRPTRPDFNKPMFAYRKPVTTPPLTTTRPNSRGNGSKPSILRKPLPPQRGTVKKENMKPSMSEPPWSESADEAPDRLSATFETSPLCESRVPIESGEGAYLHDAFVSHPVGGCKTRKRDNGSPGPTASTAESLDTSHANGSMQAAVEAETSITLIRRDPTSGAQWNVGQISDPPVPEISSETIGKPLPAQVSRRAGAPIYIKINNPGYNKFASEDVATSTSASATERRTSPQQNDVYEPTKPWSQRPRSTHGTFRRRLWMEHSRSEPSTRHRKASSNSSDNTNADNRMSIEHWRSDAGHIHSGSNDSVHHLPKQYSTLHPPTTSAPRRSPNSKGYVFMSPWDGRCEFSSGSGGRSLFCNHILPTASSTASPSLPVPISELRFNLPILSALSAPPTPGPEGTQRSSFFGRSRRQVSLSSGSALDTAVSIDDDINGDSDRLNLSLGQERAGGGFGGKQAKLGKLIIEDEGQKMLDLVVAANMGLWWRAYEKAEGRRQHARRRNNGSGVLQPA